MAGDHKFSSEEKPRDSETSSTHVDAILKNALKEDNGVIVPQTDQPESLDKAQRTPSDPKIELTEADCYDQLGYSFSSLKKWTIIMVIFLVQVSMNFNTSLYSNAVGGISEEFNVSKQAARCGAMIFLVLYAFGCELWAPWSEELGRKPILQASLFLVNIWQIPVAIAPNFATIIVGRALGGLSSAGGSVTLGMIADLWEAEDQQYAVACVVFSSVAGSVIGPVVGGFVEQFLPWRWNIWIQLIFGGFVQALHFVLVPETRTTIMLDKIAKRKRKSGENLNVYGPNELVPYRERFSVREVLVTWIRPFRMFLTEPIVMTLSLLSGFSDALIFMFIQSFALVYGQWNFSAWAIGLSFIPILVGYFIAYASFIPVFRRNKAQRLRWPDDERTQYESRLWWLLYTAPCLPIGLFGFAWTSLSNVHWIGSMIFAAIVGIANYAIYMATIDYMICAYGPYSASATGGNGWARDFLAGVLTVPATPFYQNIGGKYHLEYASTILGCISFVLVLAVYVVYWYGPTLRKRSPFAQQLSDARAEMHQHMAQGQGVSQLNSRANSFVRSQQNLRIRQTLGSRQNSYIASRDPSQANSRVASQANSRVASRRNSLS
ncbi:putative MFS multidrug transporter [Aspergillus chevalieri]|uniref:Major facilitator superfamily (MFS) profile domain-containing protein n=1 Tax=Aspergillus chevalieri TaxID=182096 RepID=A0A7R7VP61_ASPCH|nr:uncharacterized protein ACHE_40840A [Aspergillus chevalieri]BCR88276.1 hypothetical protein ACHE_40840A [Aspergillus chevalieri]